MFLGEGLTIAQQIGVERHVSQGLWSFGALAIKQGAYVAGVRLIAAAGALHPPVKASLDADEQADWDASLDAARAGLGEVEFETAWAEGQEMTREEAVQSALGQ